MFVKRMLDPRINKPTILLLDTFSDTLSAISKTVYGSANDYQRIFEANKPMLKHPDKIYPGQVLIIPNK